MGVGAGQPTQPPKETFPDPQLVVILKRGETRTVQWCWNKANGRAELWYVTKDGVLPPQNQIDYGHDQHKLDDEGVHSEVDPVQSHRLSAELFTVGPYTEEQKKYANTYVTGAVFHISATKVARLGGHSVFVHNISGTGYSLRMTCELHILVTRQTEPQNPIVLHAAYAMETYILESLLGKCQNARKLGY